MCVTIFSFSVCLQYHNKVTCFMLQQIEEPCSLGAHAAVIVPPTWIIRVRRPQVYTTLCYFPITVVAWPTEWENPTN